MKRDQPKLRLVSVDHDSEHEREREHELEVQGWAILTSPNYCIRATIVRIENNELSLLLDDFGALRNLDIVTIDYLLSGHPAICDQQGVVIGHSGTTIKVQIHEEWPGEENAG